MGKDWRIIMNEKDPFVADYPLYDYSIEYDYSHLPETIINYIKELEELDKVGDWFNYDLKFDELDIYAKSCCSNGVISDYDYEKILNKYGGLYD